MRQNVFGLLKGAIVLRIWLGWYLPGYGLLQRGGSGNVAWRSGEEQTRSRGGQPHAAPRAALAAVGELHAYMNTRLQMLFRNYGSKRLKLMR